MTRLLHVVDVLGGKQYFNQMIAVQKRVDDEAADQQINTSRSREGGKQYFNQMIAVQERVDNKDADQQSNTSRESGEKIFQSNERRAGMSR